MTHGDGWETIPTVNWELKLEFQLEFYTQGLSSRPGFHSMGDGLLEGMPHK